MKGDKQKKAMFDRYSSRLMSQGAVRKQYLNWVQDFLNYMEDADFHDEEVTRKKVQGFLRKMEQKHNYAQSSMRLLWSTIRAFFSRNLLPWPFGRGEGPQISEPEINAPALAPNLINEIIKTVKEEGSDKQRAFLALNTIYGLRPIEMRQLKATDINLKDKIIYIETAKHGRARSHLIPDALVPVLAKWDFSQSVSASAISMMWYEIEMLADVEHYPHVGFHSIRRTLDTLLGEHFSPSDVKMFLRWKRKGGTDMQMSYSSTVFVDRKGATTSAVKPRLSDLDMRIFEQHPFLEAWR